MTDNATKQVQRRKPLSDKRRKKRCLLLALVLFLGSGAFLFHKEKFYAVTEILAWLKQNRSAETQGPIPAASARGSVFDRNFRPLAATYETYAVYARPLEMDDPAASAELLAGILGLDQNDLLTSLKGERGFVWIAKGIDQGPAESINERKIKGIYQVVETNRFYPNQETAAHAVGFVENGQGLDGVEFHYNTLLREDEINGAELEALHFDSAAELGRTSTHLVLNLDLLIQSRIERYLERRAKITGAASGGVLLLDADTGGVLAMASYPPFNPNRYWEFSNSALNNHIVTEPVYPGELSLIFRQAAAINQRNEKKSQDLNGLEGAETLLVLEPKTLKRKKLSAAPRIDAVDADYLARFIENLGFGRRPLTDIPLKDETPVSSALALDDPSFHSSALRLLTGFTALVNDGRIVTPHLLHAAYPRGNPKPVEPNLSGVVPTALLHPDTSNDLLEFLADKWLKINRRGKASQTPMFFEAHRFAEAPADSGHTLPENDTAQQAGQVPRLKQSIMLGAILGRDTKLTMIALLSYPESYDAGYPDALETFGGKFSILSPDQDMLQKMLYVAGQSPPVPTPDFWSSGTVSAHNKDYQTDDKDDKGLRSSEGGKNMPDVTGKSLRAGLQALQHFNLNIKIVGSGRIVAQHPAAGAMLKNTTECILELQQEI